MIIDGRMVASELEKELAAKVVVLGDKPKIVSILVGSDPASLLYSELKEKAARRVGIDFEILKVDEIVKEDLIDLVRKVAAKEQVTGVMLQLPIPNITGLELNEVLKAIPLSKDVDGMRWEESGIMPATVSAVIHLINNIERTIQGSLLDKKVVVVGARGAVGRPLVYYLKKLGYRNVAEVEWDTTSPADIIRTGEVVISCVGKEGLVTTEMVTAGSIVIDVGAPRGDMMKEVYDNARIAVGVPNGVGPVTIACLMNNVLDFVKK